jgi:hypothetical protein
MRKLLYFFTALIFGCNVQAANYNVLNPILCHSDSAIIEIVGSSGFPPYTNTGVFMFAAGTHTVLVTDSLQTTDTLIFTITQPSPVSINAVLISALPLCQQDSVSIQIEKFGGVGFYQILDTIKTVGGTQIISATDTNNCIGLDTLYITQPQLLEATTFVVQPILCNGDTAQISVGAIGGTPPYTNTINYFYTAGAYTNFIADANGCIDSFIIQVTEPLALSVSLSTTPDNGTNTGTANFVINGGVPPYKLFIDSSIQSTTALGNLKYGIYNYYIIDGNFCITSGTMQIALQYPSTSNNINENNFVRVFPNPVVNGSTMLQFLNDGNENTTIEILNSSGQVIAANKFSLRVISANSMQLNCEKMNAGLYFIMVKNDKDIQVLKLLIL